MIDETAKRHRRRHRRDARQRAPLRQKRARRALWTSSSARRTRGAQNFSRRTALTEAPTKPSCWRNARESVRADVQSLLARHGHLACPALFSKFAIARAIIAFSPKTWRTRTLLGFGRDRMRAPAMCKWRGGNKHRPAKADEAGQPHPRPPSYSDDKARNSVRRTHDR